jgi:hypothetical protein
MSIDVPHDAANTATRRFIMQQIPLSQGQIALVDDEDFDRIAQYHWCYRGERNSGQGYAIRHDKDGKKYRTVYLHREIVGLVPPEHEVIFRNGDRLDCRRENLRVVSKQEARQHHRRARSNSKSGIKGLRYNRRPRTWSVDLYRDGQAKRVGTFWTLKEAKEAHQEALRRENPGLHAAPERVERSADPAPVRPAASDGSCPS